MNINKLKESNVREFKNYKVTCEFLEEEVKSGKSKKLQLEDWMRYFDYHKEGNKIIIDNIYEIEKEKKDARTKGNNSIYMEDISNLILDLLAQNDKDELFLSAGTLLKNLDMVNNNYSQGRQYISKLSELVNVPEQNIYDFYNHTQSKLKGSVERSLNNLRKKSLIIWEKVVAVCIRHGNIQTNELKQIKLNVNENSNRAYIDTILIHREATKLEKQLILKVEKEVLKELKCDNQQQVFISGQWNYFRKRVNSILKDSGNIQYYYDSYRITYNKDDIAEEIENLKEKHKLSDMEGFITRSNLNVKVQNGLIDSAIRRNENATKKILQNAIEELVDGYLSNPKVNDLLYSNEEYLKHTSKLIDTTISMFAEVIVDKLKEPLKRKEEPNNIKEDDEIPF